MNGELEQVLSDHRKSLINVIIADELVEYLPSLQTEDVQAIEADQKNYGKVKAAKCLLDRVRRKSCLEEFMTGLEEAGYVHLVKHIRTPGKAISTANSGDKAQENLCTENSIAISCTGEYCLLLLLFLAPCITGFCIIGTVSVQCSIFHMK